MPMFVRVICAGIGIGLVLLAFFAFFSVHPLLWKPLFGMLGILALGGDFLGGAWTARWPLLLSF